LFTEVNVERATYICTYALCQCRNLLWIKVKLCRYVRMYMIIISIQLLCIQKQHCFNTGAIKYIKIVLTYFKYLLYYRKFWCYHTVYVFIFVGVNFRGFRGHLVIHENNFFVNPNPWKLFTWWIHKNFSSSVATLLAQWSISFKAPP